MEQIKVISFDIGNTLYKSNNKNSISYKLANAMNVNYVNFKTEYQRIFDYSNDCLDIKIKNLCKIFNKEDFISQAKNIIETTIEKCELEPIDKDVEKLLRKLKTDGYILICISKSSNLQAQIKGQYLLKYFDYIFRTADFGLSKRDFKLYSIIASKLKVNPNQIIHIGDAYYDDYIYPQKYGINTILYNNKRYTGNCNSLKELYKKIKIIAKS